MLGTVARRGAHGAHVVDDGVEALASVVVIEACRNARSTPAAAVLPRVQRHRLEARGNVGATAGAALASATVVCRITRELETAERGAAAAAAATAHSTCPVR